jgi:6-phosphogluconate dehydrogenase (decarboxylating)
MLRRNAERGREEMRQMQLGVIGLGRMSGNIVRRLAASDHDRVVFDCQREPAAATVLSAALYVRFRSREQASYADRLLSATREGFGGHVEPRAG